MAKSTVACDCQDFRNSLVLRASNHMMRYTISMTVLLLACMAGIAHAAPATQPTPKAAARVEQLKAGVKTFSLTLNYRGEQDKPYYRMMLSVQPVVRFKGNAFDVYTQITEAQATKIIDFLATEGFLDRALNPNRNRSPAPPPEPYYTLAVHVDAEVGFEDWLGFDLNMLKRLDGLRAVLDGDAAKQMDLLLGRLSGHRKQWESAYASFYTGQIKAIGQGTLDLHVLRGHSGIIHPVNTDAKTEVILLNGKAGKLSDLKVDQWIKVYWDPDPNDPKQQRIVKIEPAMPSWAGQRLADLEKTAGTLDVSVRMFITGKGNEEELHFLGPDHSGGYKEPFFARLSKDEMSKLLGYLALEGFLADAVEGPMKRTPMPPYVELWVGDFHQWWSWTPETIRRLEGLKAALPDKAAQKIDTMVVEMRGQIEVPATRPAAVRGQ